MALNPISDVTKGGFLSAVNGKTPAVTSLTRVWMDVQFEQQIGQLVAPFPLEKPGGTSHRNLVPHLVPDALRTIGEESDWQTCNQSPYWTLRKNTNKLKEHLSFDLVPEFSCLDYLVERSKLYCQKANWTLAHSLQSYKTRPPHAT